MHALNLGSFSSDLPELFSAVAGLEAWDAAAQLSEVLAPLIARVSADYVVVGQSAIHKTAHVHPTVVISEPTIIGDGAVVGPNVRLRGGVFLGRGATVGPSGEVKSSWVFEDAALAHLNYVGNSVIGHGTNIEAGAVLANHFNERDEKAISVLVDGTVHDTGLAKFGAAVGPGSRIGANAVTTPGTYLPPASIVGRLELIDQMADRSEWLGRSRW